MKTKLATCVATVLLLLPAACGSGGGGGGGGGLAAPTFLGAQAISPTSIGLSWTDASTEETGFEIERATSLPGPFTQVGLAQANLGSYFDTGLQPSTTYHYRVRAVNASGGAASTYSIGASATTPALPATAPAPPTSAEAVALSSTGIQVAWTDASIDETGFEVERADSPSGPFTLLGSTPANQPGLIDQGLQPSTTYSYRIRAVNASAVAGGLASEYSSVASATTLAPAVTPPSGPTLAVASALFAGSLRLTWIDTSSDETGFEVERASTVAGPFTLVGTTPANQASFDDTGLGASATYHYRVRAVNQAGASGYSNTASGTTQPVVILLPFPPTNLAAAALGSASIRVTWTDNANDETGYRIERATSPAGPFAAAGTVGPNVTAFDDGGLAEATTYAYRVCATRQDHDSVFSSTASATTLAAAATPPSPPQMAWVSAPFAGALRVNWVDASTDETGFEVERASAVAGPFTLVGTTPADQASFDDTGLGASATYHYRVRAVNQAGASGYSNTASGATQAAGFQTAYIVASSDNTVRISSMNAQEELTVYQSNGNEVGCIWTFLDPVQHMLCDAVLLRFDVSALAGKTILAAGINLFAERPAINQARYMMSALAGPWSPATVTFDNMPGSFQAGSWFLYSESVPTWMTWPATPIVQSWASGTWANNGVIVQDFDVVFPYLSLLRSTRFASREVYGDPARWPVLVVDYQ